MRNIAEKIIHAIIVITVAWAVAMNFFGKADALGAFNIGCFKYFTTDSNILAAAASLMCLLFSKRLNSRKWFRIFRFVFTASVTVTFLTVIVFLGPGEAIRQHSFSGYLSLYEGSVFVLHLTAPILSIIALVISEIENITKKECLWAVLPVMVYSIVYLIMVVFLKEWKDFYNFSFGGQYQFVPLVMLVMYLFAAAIGLCLRGMKQLADKHFENKAE